MSDPYFVSWYRLHCASMVRQAEAFAKGMEMWALDETRKDLLALLKRKRRARRKAAR